MKHLSRKKKTRQSKRKVRKMTRRRGGDPMDDIFRQIETADIDTLRQLHRDLAKVNLSLDPTFIDLMKQRKQRLLDRSRLLYDAQQFISDPDENSVASLAQAQTFREDIPESGQEIAQLTQQIDARFQELQHRQGRINNDILKRIRDLQSQKKRPLGPDEPASEAKLKKEE
jgi:hypothetical protein